MLFIRKGFPGKKIISKISTAPQIINDRPLLVLYVFSDTVVVKVGMTLEYINDLDLEKDILSIKAWMSYVSHLFLSFIH